MKRVQLFEFEDFHWFPSWIRAAMTNLIVVMHKLMGTKEVIVPIVERALKISNQKHIVDMGSGSGGIMPMVLETLNAGRSESEAVQLLLTDLHPNQAFIEQIEQENNPNLSFYSKSVDATNFEKAPAGIKTMMNSFHHMPPTEAKSILQSAQKNKETFLIYEMAENKIPLVLWWLFLPVSLCIVFVMALILTPFAQQVTFKQLIFTYLIPIIPIFYAWDGQASMPRMYAFNDLETMIADFKSEDYRWEIDQAKNAKGKASGYYVLGYPLN